MPAAGTQRGGSQSPAHHALVTCTYARATLPPMGLLDREDLPATWPLHAAEAWQTCQSATSPLTRQARELGADAVIGLDYDMFCLGSNMIAVSANGVGVKLESSSDEAFGKLGIENSE